MGEHKYKFQELVRAVSDLDIPGSITVIRDLASRGVSPRVIQQNIEIGMKLVGEYYGAGDYFIADMLFAGHLYKTILHQKEMQISGETVRCRVVTGMVPGDLHETGKDIVAATLQSYGFTVANLSPQESTESFLKHAAQHDPDIVIIGSRSRDVPASLPRLIQAIRETMAGGCRILVGGTMSLSTTYRTLGSDGFAADALNALDQCLDLSRKAEL